MKAALLKPELKTQTRAFIKKFLFNRAILQFDIAIFFRQLATLISANIPIVQSCDILQQSQEKIPLKLLIRSLKQEIESGKTFAESLKKFPRYFDEFVCHLIHTGEYSGTLEKMLKRIAHHQEKSLALKNKIKQALFYPTIIFIVAIIVSLIMLIFIVPQFVELFQNMHGTLPAFTKAIIFLSDTLRENYWLTLLPIFGMYLFIYYYKNSRPFKSSIDSILFTIPFLKTIFQKTLLIRFSRGLATTYAAGVPILDALKIITYASHHVHYTKAITTLQTDVKAGKQLHASMQRNSLFSAMSVQMVKVGEESGSLDFMLEKIAEIYENDIDHIAANLSHLIEPLIMIILGVLIGGLVIAMYLPIFKLGTII